MTIGIYRCLSLEIKFHWFQRCHVCMFWFDWVRCDSKKKVCILIQSWSFWVNNGDWSPFPFKPGSLPPAWGSCCPHSAHRRQATVGSNLPPTPFKEAVSISLRVVTFCIPGLRLHQTSSPTKPQSHLLYLTSLSLTLFPWRWSSIEFLPTRVRLVAQCCSPGRDLDAVHGEGESERGGGCTERAWGFREIVWLHYCNHAEIKQESSILWGLQGNCFCVQRRWDHMLFVLRKERETHPFTERARGGELNRWLGHTRQKQNGMIRKSLCTLRGNSAVRLCNREEKGKSSFNAKGLQIPTRTSHSDRCNQTHNMAGKESMQSAISCRKMHKFSEVKWKNRASYLYPLNTWKEPLLV